VNRLPYTATGDMLKETFKGCVNATVVMDPITGESKGYAECILLIYISLGVASVTSWRSVTLQCL